MKVIDLDQAKLDPASVFGAPKDVLVAPGLSLEDKKAILIRWEADEEGMPPANNRNPGEMLRAVHEALERLEAGA